MYTTFLSKTLTPLGKKGSLSEYFVRVRTFCVLTEAFERFVRSTIGKNSQPVDKRLRFKYALKAGLPAVFTNPHSFPLYRAGRLGAYVEYYAVDAPHFRYQTRRHPPQNVMRQTRPVGRHAVNARHGTNRQNLFVSPEISHNPHGRDG